MHQEDKDFQDDLFEEDDPDADANELENNFMENCGKGNEGEPAPYLRKIPTPIEQAFILYSYYKDKIEKVGMEYNCNVRIRMKEVKIFSSVDNIDDCVKALEKKIKKIQYRDFGTKENLKIFYSPFFTQSAKSRSFGLAKFNGKLYCHSDKLNDNDLKKAARELFLGKKLFQIIFKKPWEKGREIYHPILGFVKKVLKHQQNEFKERQVISEIDSTQSVVYCIGERQRNVLACKNIIKNIFESIAVVIIRYQDVFPEIHTCIQKAKVYADSVSQDFPVFISHVQQKTVAIISKHNILKKLILKDKLIKKLSLKEKKNEIGLFFLKGYHFHEKKAMIDDLCGKKGYDMSTYGGYYYYLKKFFKEEDQQPKPDEILTLLSEILAGYKDAKERYDVPTKTSKFHQEAEEIQRADVDYYETGDSEIDNDLSNLLSRDVLKERIKMTKKGYVKYRLAEGEEFENVIWHSGQNGDLEQCKAQDLKPKHDYFLGSIKKTKQKKEFFYQYKITVI